MVESFIHILHIVSLRKALHDALQVVLFSVWCNIDVHYERLAEECLLCLCETLMCGEDLGEREEQLGILEQWSVNQIFFVH